MRQIAVVFLLLTLPIRHVLFAQETPRPHPGPIRFSHQNAENAYLLATSAILQDNEGYMWFGQSNTGELYRYDGYEYASYTHDPSDSLSLGPGLRPVLYEDSRHVLWVGKELGVGSYDRETDTFRNYAHNPDDSTSISPGQVNSILEDSQGNFWIGTDNGLDLFDRESGTFAHFLPDSTNPWIGPLLEDAQGTLWVGSWGLLRFDPSRGTFTRHLPELAKPIPAPDDSIQPYWVNAIHEDTQGRLWIGTWNTGGLYRFDGESGTFTNFRHDPSKRLPFASDRIRTIVGDPAGGLWLATYREGLIWFDPVTGEMTAYRNEPTDSYSLSGDDVLSLYEDRQGVFWAGSWWHGLNRFDRAARPVAHYYAHTDENQGLIYSNVLTMAEESNEIVWVVENNTGFDNDRVLTRIDRGSGTYNHFRPDEDNPRSLTRWAYRPYVDRSGILWTGGNDVLSRMDPDRAGRFTHFRYDPADERSVPAGRARYIYEDTRGRLWIGTDGFGLSRIDDRERGTVTRFPFGEDMGQANHIFEDSNGVLWVSTWLNGGGLFRFEPETGQYVRYRKDSSSLASDNIYAAYERPQEPGVLWLGLGVGLGRWEPASDSFRLFTTADGLPNNDAQGVLGDDDGRLWISTDVGISRYDPDTGKFNNYDVDDGLQGKSFNAWSFHKGRSGQLYFGGPNGLNVFYPDEVRDNPNPPQLLLTSLRLGREAIKPDPNGPLKKRLAATSALTLAHNQNDLTLGFVGLHFRHPNKNRYTYSLEGYDETWSDTTDVRQASYTNLPPGEYTFRVTAANSDGVWNEEPLVLAIAILPPWWRTWWAYAVYFLLLAGAAVQGYRWQHERVVRREREAARERELEQAREIERQHTELVAAHESLKTTQGQLVQSEKMASLGQLTSGIAHELKNPLNFVTNFAEMNEELAKDLVDTLSAAADHGQSDVRDDLVELAYGLKTNSSQIAKHGKRADEIVKTMMQHARTGTGERYEVAVNKLVDEYVTIAYRGMQAAHENLQVRIERAYDESVGSVDMVPQELGRVIMNLMNNAFQAVTEKAGHGDDSYEPAVSVSTHHLENEIEIRIADNGPGISAEIRDKVFEPFFTTRSTGEGHTGLGLSLSYEIVTKGHGGTLHLQPEDGAGAKFVVTLPQGSSDS